MIDIDSLPVEVHGEQPGSAWNGHYRRRVYHPIVGGGETGDILDLRLREGQVHTADGGLEFVLEVLERAERHLCGSPTHASMNALKASGRFHFSSSSRKSSTSCRVASVKSHISCDAQQ